MLKAKLKAIQV